MKALFLDRDGIINREIEAYVWKVSDFEFNKGIFGFLRKFRDLGYEVVVITNQGGIDKGLYAREDVEILHKWMTEKLREEGISLKGIYYCPHHDDVQRCLCRKPGGLLIQKALAVHGIDASASLMIGDRERDVEAARAAGVKGILLPSNSDFNTVDPASMI